MAYCPRCGVEIEERHERCPLCNTKIPDEVREQTEEPGDFPEEVIPPKPLYRKLSARHIKLLIFSLMLFAGLFPIALTVGIDLARNGSVTWSYFVAVPLVGAAVIGWFFIHYGRSPLISVTAAMLVLMLVQMVLQARLNPGNVFNSPELPYFVASFVAVELFLLYLTRKRPGLLQLFSFLLFDAALLLGAIDLIISGSLSWSLVVTAVLLPVSLYLMYLKHSKNKGLNLVGAFFLDLSLMMIALNYTISGTLDWSLITSLIFIPFAGLAYVLHITLFNDTDWKKALHL